MTRVTLAKVNAAIASRGIAAELVKGAGYFYFVGPDVDGAYSTSVMVYRLDQLTVGGWADECARIRDTVAAK